MMRPAPCQEFALLASRQTYLERRSWIRMLSRTLLHRIYSAGTVILRGPRHTLEVERM